MDRLAVYKDLVVKHLMDCKNEYLKTDCNINDIQQHVCCMCVRNYVAGINVIVKNKLNFHIHTDTYLGGAGLLELQGSFRG